MTEQLNPAVLSKLDAFGQRRRALIIYRGVCAGIISLVIAMIVVAIADWLFFLPDQVRWLLSLAAYAMVGVVVWFTCVRLIWRIPTASRLARLIETAEPGLREDLLSAVELSEQASVRPWDSRTFRRFLQEDVAHRMSGVNVTDLLPWRLIQQWMNVAIVVLVLLLVLLCLPGLHFGRRVARAMLPMASIDRVSLTSIEIISPNPPNAVVAQGEQIDIVVGVSGPDGEDDVSLELISEDGETNHVAMTTAPGGDRTFQSTVRIGRQSIQYRIWANDARSEKHIISARQRPQATAFEKHYRYPQYLGMSPKTQQDTSGDLAGVVGTEVDLVVDVNQAITLAHAIITTDQREQTIPLTPEIDRDGQITQRIRGTIPMSAVGTYRLHLVAAETGLENKFSPEYMINAGPDLAPTIRISQPPPAILVPSDEVVNIQGSAEDDWALSEVQHHVKVNDDPWQLVSTIRADEDAATAKLQIDHPWDIYPLDLEPGSVVFAKLIAIDRKGLRGESRPIRAVISSHQFDPQRWAGLAAAREAHSKLVALQESASGLQQATQEVSNQQEALVALSSADAFDQSFAAAIASVTDATRASSPGRPSIDLVLVGQAISQAATVGAGFVRNHLSAARYDEARKAADIVVSRVTGATAAYDHLLRLSELSAVASDLDALNAMHREAIGRLRGDAPDSLERISRRTAAIGAEASVLAAFLHEMTPHADDSMSTQLAEIETALNEVKSIGDPFSGAPTSNSVSQAGQKLTSSLTTTTELFRRTLNTSSPPRDQLWKAAGTTHAPVFRAARFARQLHEMKRALGVQAERGELDQLQSTAQKTKRTREISTAAFDAAVAGLMMSASLQQKRPDSDLKFVADSSRAWRAVESIRARTASGGNEEASALDDLDRLAAAVRIINTVHLADQSLAILQAMSRNEPNELSGDQAASEEIGSLDVRRAAEQASDWVCTEAQFHSLSSHLTDAALAEPLQLLTQMLAGEDLKLVHQEMLVRPTLGRAAQNRNSQLDRLVADLRRIRALLEQPLADARQTLQGLSPRIDQMLSELAREVRAEEAELDELQQAVDQAEPEAIDEQLAAQLDELQELAARLEEARAALREDAADQDVMTDEGRQRMRDDDDALAMLDGQPDETAEAIRQAVAAEDPLERQNALAAAARQQAELAQQLEELAEHFENLHEGNAEQSRQALRGAEDELGIREQLEAQQRQLQQLAALAELPPEQALEALEEELANNRPMQRELDELSRDQLQQTEAELAAAAAQQEQLADEASERLQRAENLQQLSEQLQQLGQQASRLADGGLAEANQAMEQQLDSHDTPTAERLSEENREAIQAVDQAAGQAVNEAVQTESGRSSPSDLADAAGQLAESLRQATRQMQQAGQAMDGGDESGGGDGDGQNAPDGDADSDAEAAAQQVAEAANQAAELAQQAEQLAEALDDAADVWEDEAVAENPFDNREPNPFDNRDEIADPSDVWEDPRQEQIEETVQQAEQDLDQVARHQQRLGNEQLAEQLGQIAEQTAQVGQQLEDFAQQAQQSAQPNQANQREQVDASEQAGQQDAESGVQSSDPADVPRQLAQAQQAIAEPAQQLEDLLAGEDFGEPAADSPLQPEVAATPQSSDPTENSGEPLAAEPTASAESGQPAMSESPFGDVPLSESAAEQLAEALNALDEQILAEAADEAGAPESGSPESGPSEPGAPESGAPESGASESRASESGASESGEATAFDDSDQASASSPSSSESGSEPGSPSAESGSESSAQSSSGSESGSPSQQVATVSPSQSSPTNAANSQNPAAASSQSGQPSQSNAPSQTGSPSQPGQSDSFATSSSPASEAILAAAGAQARAIAQSRFAGEQTATSSAPTSQGFASISMSGAAIDAPAAVTAGALPPLQEMKKADWAKLPPKLANDLMEGSREKVSPRYRQAIETYFRLLAEQARQ